MNPLVPTEPIYIYEGLWYIVFAFHSCVRAYGHAIPPKLRSLRSLAWNSNGLFLLDVAAVDEELFRQFMCCSASHTS